MVVTPKKARMMGDMGPVGLSPSRSAVRGGTSGGRILGVDPGLKCTGYAVLCEGSGEGEARVIEAGAIKLEAKRPLAQRLLELQECLGEVLRAHEPSMLACEQLYSHYKHPRTAILMAHARGIVLAQAARWGLQIVPVSATRAKKLLTGSGRAGKAQIQRAVARTLGLPTLPEPHDVADALAIALCGLRLRAGEQGAMTGAAEARR
jgi:crossover junction endodeoxyribonuclease RuvC